MKTDNQRKAGKPCIIFDPPGGLLTSLTAPLFQTAEAEAAAKARTEESGEEDDENDKKKKKKKVSISILCSISYKVVIRTH